MTHSNTTTNLPTQLKRLFFALLMLGLLFGAYGGLDWWVAWGFIGLFIVAKALFSVQLKKKDPELVRRREEMGAGTKTWDRVWLGLFALMFLALMVVAGLDAGRFHWSAVPLWGAGIGVVAYLLSMFFTYRAMSANTHFEGTVRIQADRNHQVVDSGPYSVIRHPGYTALIINVISIPAILGTGAAFIPAVIISAMFILRTALEDRTLQKELNGYRAYTQRVRFRLVPGVW